MGGIFGLIRFDGAPVDPSTLEAMRQAMAFWGPDGGDTRSEGPAGFGYLHFLNTPEAAGERLPRPMPDGGWLTAAARVDNRAELCSTLGMAPAESTGLPDSAIIERAWLRWGEACVERIYGDWSFAVWNPRERRLFLARDHHGNTALYYYRNPRYFAFASSRKALLALNEPELRTLDDLYIAQLLLSWSVHYGERTVHPALHRLPPAHILTADATAVHTGRYWRLEDAPLLPVKSLAEAVEGFLPVFDEAVRCRLRSARPVATTLSGGLDSSAVTAIAARLLAADGRTLPAYTSIPVSATAINNDQRFGDEWELAQATARFYGNIRHHPIPASSLTPLQGLRESLRVHDEPVHAGGNAYWLQELQRSVHTAGCGVLLTGQGGNASISWTGAARRNPVPPTLLTRIKTGIKRTLPREWSVGLAGWQLARAAPWRQNLALHLDLERRTDVLRRSLGDPLHPLRHDYRNAVEQRLEIIMPGRNPVGFMHAENGAATGLEIRDPTLDPRVLAYCLGIPDHLHTDPATKLDRLIIRTAMAGQVPDAVRLNRKRGLQAADLPFRLRADRAAMEACLDELERGPAARYVSLPRMRQALSIVLERDDPTAFREAGVVLLRAINVGLFVNAAAGPASP